MTEKEIRQIKDRIKALQEDIEDNYFEIHIMEDEVRELEEKLKIYDKQRIGKP
jgi:predicted  nucleic acid-binding Zn-ribbon protein